MKTPADGSLAAGQTELLAAGVDAQETHPTRLMPLTGRSPALDLAVIERLARVADDERAAALRTLATSAEQRGWKTVAKDARRALYRFSQRGVVVPPKPEPAAAPRRVATSALEGFVSAIDGRGDRLVWLARPRREGGLLVLTAIVNEPAGLRDVALAELNRKTLKRMEQDVRTEHGLRMVPADGGYCDALLAEAYERARAAEVGGVGEYPTYRARLVTHAAGSLDPPLVARVLTADELATGGAVERAAALLDEPEFVTWLLERTALQSYLDEITAARESPLLLSRPQQEERIEGIIGRALRELFSGANADPWRRRLEEMGYVLFATGRRELAVAAAATARALAASRAGGHGLPFFEALTRRSIASLANEDAARAEESRQTSLLVKPTQARAGRPPLVPQPKR